MKDIPTQILKHNNEEVFFAFRTMEDNHLLHKNDPNPPHRHEFYTILLVKDAYGTHFIDFVEYKIKPQVVFFVNVDQVHQVLTNDTPSGDILMFSNEFLTRNYISRDFISNLGIFSCTTVTPPLEMNADDFAKLVSFSAEIRKAFEGDSPFKFDIIAAHLKLFLIECNRFVASPIDENNPQALQSGRGILRKFRDLLETKFVEWHKVNEYAEAMSISPDYLNNVVKNSIGKTAKEMILQRIVLEAKRMGLHTNLSSKEIAYKLGYDDPSHFSKLFKKETNQSFTNFRASLID
ncbi:MAG: helix-turn-helix domain-containing protein [Prolixibacteraceae bacterium]|nr:helix-turn-helix domain-containing protein [Prolixibacteraceae bacterium]